MSFGKKKSKTPKIKISAPPQTQQFEFRSPTGDIFKTRQEGTTQINESQLGSFSQGLVSRSQEGLTSIANALDRPDAQRATDIRKRSDDLFKSQAQGINQDADNIFSKARSTLAKRFGGSFNSSFGNDFLARLENNRLGQLAGARRQSNLLGEQLALSDEDSRIRRAGVFQSFLNDINAQAQGFSQTGSSLLQNETRRASDIAIARAGLLQRAISQENTVASRRRSSLGQIASFASALF